MQKCLLKKQLKISYIYILLDPRKKGKYKYCKYKFNYEPIYVGVGKGFRARNHFYCIKHTKGHSYKENVIRKIFKEAGNKPIVIYYKKNITKKQAIKYEVRLIKTIGRRDLKTGQLLNLTDGGEGGGTNPSKKERLRRSNFLSKRNIILSKAGKLPAQIESKKGTHLFQVNNPSKWKKVKKIVSEKSKEHCLKLIKLGKHPWQNPSKETKKKMSLSSQRNVKNGTHFFVKDNPMSHKNLVIKSVINKIIKNILYIKERKIKLNKINYDKYVPHGVVKFSKIRSYLKYSNKLKILMKGIKWGTY